MRPPRIFDWKPKVTTRPPSRRASRERHRLSPPMPSNTAWTPSPVRRLNLLHEVRVLVVDGDAAQFPNHGGPLRRTRSVHLDADQLRQLQHRGADATRGPVDQHT